VKVFFWKINKKYIFILFSLIAALLAVFIGF